MDILNERPETPEINYPCQWTYKVIGLSEASLKQAIKDVLGKKVHTFKHSMDSKKGKYVSYALIVVVESDSERKQLFTLLQKNEAIKMLL